MRKTPDKRAVAAVASAILALMPLATPLMAQWAVKSTATQTTLLSKRNRFGTLGWGGSVVGNEPVDGGTPINVVWNPIDKVYYAAENVWSAGGVHGDLSDGKGGLQFYMYGADQFALTGCSPFCDEPEALMHPSYSTTVRNPDLAGPSFLFHASSMFWNPNAPDHRTPPGTAWYEQPGDFDVMTPFLNLEALRTRSPIAACVAGYYPGGDLYTIPTYAYRYGGPFDAFKSGSCLPSSGMPPYTGSPAMAPQKLMQIIAAAGTDDRLNYDGARNQFILSSNTRFLEVWDRGTSDTYDNLVEIALQCELAPGGCVDDFGMWLGNGGDVVYDSFFDIFVSIDPRTNSANVYHHDGTYLGTSLLPGLDFSNPDTWGSVSFANGQLFAYNTASEGWQGYDIMEAVAPAPDPAVAPEPSSMVLLATGLTGIAVVRRRRRS